MEWKICTCMELNIIMLIIWKYETGFTSSYFVTKKSVFLNLIFSLFRSNLDSSNCSLNPVNQNSDTYLISIFIAKKINQKITASYVDIFILNMNDLNQNISWLYFPLLRSMHNNDTSYHIIYSLYLILPSIFNHYLLSISTHSTKVVPPSQLVINKDHPSVTLWLQHAEYNHKDLNVSCELEFPLSFSNPLYILLLQNLSRLWYINQKIAIIWYVVVKWDALKDWVLFHTTSAISR